MSMVFENNAQTIGNTPLVKICNIAPKGVTILAKIEGRNPGFSVKSRIAASMILAAEGCGKLKKGMSIIEPTSGNTGIGLAFVAAARQYEIILTMPSSMSIERRQILKALGAKVILTDPSLGMNGAMSKAHEIISTQPNHYFMPDQFSNPANPLIHEQTTGPEIWRDTQGVVDVLVAGVGTGGTITGISRYLKVHNKNLISVAVEPSLSPVISQTLAHTELVPGSHNIQGIGAGFISENLDLSLVDKVELVDNDTAKNTALHIMKEEGILCGISSGAAMSAALNIASNPNMQGKTIVVILPDSAERYLSSTLFSEVFTEQELKQ